MRPVDGAPSANRRGGAWLQPASVAAFSSPMKVYVHALSGAALGHALDHPILAFPAGLASHILLDALPHNDRLHPLDPILTVASLVGVAVLFGPLSPEMCGAIGATVPDLEHLAGRGPGAYRKRFPAHTARSRVKHGPRADRPLLSAVITLGSLAVLLAGHRRPIDAGP
jgi:hypothetical protein